MALIRRTGKLVWRGDIGSSSWTNESLSNVMDELNVTALETFAAAVEPYSNCNLTYIFYVRSSNLTAGAPGISANIDKKAILYFRDPATLEVLNFQYPDPIAANIEVTPWGKKIKDSAVVAIVALLSTMTGISYEPMYGVYYQRK